MMDSQLITELAELCNMPASYLNWAEEPTEVADENKISALQAMGFDMSSDQSVRSAIQQRIEQQWGHTVPPVTVVHQGKKFQVELCLDQASMPAVMDYEILLESGETLTQSVTLTELETVDRLTLSQVERIKVILPLPQDLPLGYHTLNIASKQSSLIVAPETCFEPQGMLDGNKIWGSGIQLYSVRSERNWGMGDFTDLKTIAHHLGKGGADVIGLNPVHALYQDNPQHCSPYSPSSREFGNVLYISPENLPEFAECAAAQAMVNEKSFQQRLAAVRSRDYVDYAETASLKYQVLEKLYEHFCEQHLNQKTARALFSSMPTVKSRVKACNVLPPLMPCLNIFANRT